VSRPPRPPSKTSASSLQNWTGWYLGRWATTTAGLRSLLMRRIAKAAELHGEDLDVNRALVEGELERLQAIGLLDDRRYAEHRARSMHRKGASSGKIRSNLMRHRVAGEVVAEAVTDLGPDAELEAARTWARKRRIGPWREGPSDRELRKKELARMGRAGFPYGIAIRVVDADE
jgi:regulatory protein